MTLKSRNVRHYAGRKPNMPGRRPKRPCARCGEEAARGRDLCVACLDAIGSPQATIFATALGAPYGETQRTQRTRGFETEAADRFGLQAPG